MGLREAMAFMHAGKLGKIKLARGICYKLRPAIGKVGPEGGKIPASIDYDLWCGPAPMQTPMMRKKLHYDWHWTWDYGNGDLGNQGIHEMDKARWGLNKNELPKSVLSLGGRFYTEPDDGDTANTQLPFRLRRLRIDLRGARLAVQDAVPREALPTTASRKTGSAISLRHRRLIANTDYSNATAYRPDGEIIKEFKGRKTTTPTSSRLSAAVAAKTKTPTSSRGISPAPCATSATSACTSGRRIRSTSRRTLSGTTRRPSPPLSAWSNI